MQATQTNQKQGVRYSGKAFKIVLGLIDLTIADPKNVNDLMELNK